MRKLAIGLTGAFLMAAVAAPASASKPLPNDEAEVGADGHKVVVCHATSSYKNPYVIIEVDIASSGFKRLTAHYEHAQEPNKKGWTDLVPAFTYGDFSQDAQGTWPPPQDVIDKLPEGYEPPAECFVDDSNGGSS